MDYKIVNCVVSVNLGYESNLYKVAKAVPKSIYDPDVFPAARIPIDGKRHVNLFPGGKAIIHTTASNCEELISNIEDTINKLDNICSQFKLGEENGRPI